MGTEDGREAAPEAPQPVHVDVHIHQESELAKLLLTKCSLLQPQAPAPGTSNQPPCRSRLLVASWVVQIVLGVLSCAQGGFFFLFRYNTVYSSGAPFWGGAVAVLAGATSFIYEKRGGICWALLRSLFALAAFSTAIATIVIGTNFGGLISYYIASRYCGNYTSSYWPTAAPSTTSPEEARRQEQCLSYMDMLQALSISCQAILLTIWVLLLLASLTPLFLYCWRRFRTKEKKDQRKLLGTGGI